MPDEQPPMGVETEARVIDAEVRPPATTRLAAWWFVVLAGTVGLVLLAVDRLRWALVALAVTLWLGAAIRAFVPERTAGGLVVRSRVFDVVALVVLGAAILLVGLNLRRV